MLDYLEQGDMALVSEAGMPGISDSRLRVESWRRWSTGYRWCRLPGASTVTTALAVSGLATEPVHVPGIFTE